MALTLGDNFSYQGAKPLDARLKYDTLAAMKAVADATMYDGCLAYCVATDKTYQWKSTNTVDEDTGKWREFSSGSGDTIQVDTLPTAGADELGNVYQYIGATDVYTHGYFYECVSDGESTPTYSWLQVEVSKGGHDIKNNGVSVTARDTMNFTDFDIEDDSTNEETDVKAHRLTQAEMSEIMSTLPGTPTELPVMFDEREAEYVIGLYVLANGTKKPVYQRCFTVSNTQKPQTILLTDAITRSNSYLVNGYGVKHVGTSGDSNEIIFPYAKNATGQSSDSHIYINQNANGTYITTDVNIGCTFDVTIQYTKTTDTPV